MAVDVRPLTAVLVLAVVLAAGTVGSVAITETGADEPATVKAVPLDSADHQLWLYTTPSRSFARPTLAVNVVVYGNPDEVRAAFLRRGEGNWNETDPNESDIAPDEAGEVDDPTDARPTEWAMADGSRRYVHLSGGEGGAWLSEAYQIHDGDYLGSRHHVRAYTAPARDANWTAIQAHHEHWDWFSGRHVVTSTAESQVYVEREFADERGGPTIARVPVGEGDAADFDHWVTVVDFRESGETVQEVSGDDRESLSTLPSPSALPSPSTATARSASTHWLTSVLLLGVVGAIGAVGRAIGAVSRVRARARNATTAIQQEFRSADGRTVLLGAVIVGVLLAVRLTGVAVERWVGLPPKPVAFVLSPVLYVGLPVATALLARPLDATRAFAGASLGFLTALLVDYTYLGVTHLPLDLLVHRGTLAVALGLVAVGSSRLRRTETTRLRYLRLGLLLWLIATVMPLLRHTPLPV